MVRVYQSYPTMKREASSTTDMQVVPDLLWPESDWPGLIQDTFLGRTRSPSPPPFVKPPSVVFVGSEQGNNDLFGLTGQGPNEEYADLEDTETPAWFYSTMDSSIMPTDLPMDYEDTYEGYHQNMDMINNTSSHITVESEDYDFSSPGSSYSSGDTSVLSYQTGSSRSQDDILEEIHRECAEIERRSQSPQSAVSHEKKPIRTQTKKSSGRKSQKKLSSDDRKKELNRIAATKYREKKRKERDHLWEEESRLEAQREQLLKTVDELNTELNYLKKLVKDMKARSGEK